MAVSENGVYRQPSPWEGKTHENPWELQGVQVFPTFSDKTHMVSRCFTMFQWVAGSSFQAWMTPLDLSGPSGFGVRSPGWPEPDGLSRTDPWTGPGLLFLGTLGLMGEKSVWDIGTLCGLIYIFVGPIYCFYTLFLEVERYESLLGTRPSFPVIVSNLFFGFLFPSESHYFIRRVALVRIGFGIWLFILNFSQVCWSVLTYNAIYRAAIRIFQILPTAQVVAKSQKSWN